MVHHARPRAPPRSFSASRRPRGVQSCEYPSTEVDGRTLDPEFDGENQM